MGTRPESGSSAADDGIVGVPLLTPEEAAAALRCSPKTIYRLVETGRLGVVRVGRLVRIPRADLAAFVEKNHREAGR